MKSIFLAASAALLAGTAASAAVTSIGNSSARTCYEAARSKSGSDESIAECNRAFNIEPLSKHDRVATHINRGIIFMHGGETEAAIRDYDAAIALDPDQGEAWLNKGLALLRTGNSWSEAVPLFDAAVAKQTSEPALAHLARGLAYESAGNVRAAYADYQRAALLDPKWERPRQELRRFQVRGRGPGGGLGAVSR